jgi:U32 family peptidase
VTPPSFNPNALKPEVMAPAGHRPQLHAAIEAGADAVYFGLPAFSARAKVGFTLDELPTALRTLHTRGVRGFVTFNTLVFDTELATAARHLAAIAEAGADAVIIQDLGALALVREIAPGLEIHASTQMSITDAHGANLAQRMGVQRVTLARELSLTEIRAIAKQSSVELETFVHGALCVAYSGQCFSSEAWGGRSANRGQCAQACRMPYDLVVDGAHAPLGDARYLLSPEDLYAISQVPELMEIGIRSLKIEGRYKEAEYVAATTAAYRKAVDDAWAQRPLSLTPLEELNLAQVYSRGLGPHFFTGTNHQAVVPGRSPRHRGVLMGKVTQVSPIHIQVEATPHHTLSPLKPGDGVVFDASDWRSPQEAEEGGRIYEVRPLPNGHLALAFATHALNSERIRPGDLLWRTDDPQLARALRPFTQATQPVHKQPVEVRVEAHTGQPLSTTWTIKHHSVQIQSPEPLVTAQNRGADEALLQDQLGRLGTTPYELTHLESIISGNPFLPASLLNQIRRQAVDALQALQNETKPISNQDPEAALQRLRNKPKAPDETNPIPPQLHLLLRTPAQLDAALELRPASITLDYLDLYGLKPSVERIKANGIAVRVASPRILKPGEERIPEFLLRLDCPLLIRPLGLLESLQTQTHLELHGDFSLNAANVLSARLLLAKGLTRLTPTHDLNALQIAALARETGPGWMEVIAYQHLPVFHTEHCVFCRFMSSGTTFKDCGRPCEAHSVELRDEHGRLHPLMADIGCRNTVFGAEAQDASPHLDLWRKTGIQHFRLEFVHESANQVTQITRAFESALRGHTPYAQLQSQLKKLAPQGTTQGSLKVIQ